MPTRLLPHPTWLHPGRWLASLRRRWLLVLLVAGFFALALLRRDEVARALHTLMRGHGPWILAAVLLQCAFYLVYAAEYRLSFATVGVRSRVTRLVPVLFASIFLKAVVPSGGVSSLAVFVDDANKRGESPVRAAQGALLVMVADLAALVPLVAYGLHYLAGQQALEAYQVLACGILFAFALTLAALIVMGRWLPSGLLQLFCWLQRAADGLGRRLSRGAPLPEDWAQRQAAEYTAAARSLSKQPRLLSATVGVALAAATVNLASLFVLSLAYDRPLGPGPLVAAYTLDIAFSIVTIVPHGIGLAESAMALTLTSLGIASASALAITVAFRGLNVWLPLAIGFFLLRRVSSLGGGEVT